VEAMSPRARSSSRANCARLAVRISTTRAAASN